MASAGRAADAGLLSRVHGLTGFDAAAVAGTGTTVAVFGVGGSGVTSLVEACHLLDPSAPVVEGRWGRHHDDRAVGIALMVLDPTSSVGDEEKDAVDELRSRFGIVALVGTKIDAFWEWPRILRAHRALLDPHEELPVFAVSSLAALSGADDESGVSAVLEWAGDHLAAPDDLRAERARIAAALGAVEHAEVGLYRQTDTEASATEVDALTRRRRQLLESRDRGRGDRLSAARTGLASARGQSLADVAAGTRALAAAATTRSASLTRRTLDDYVRWLRAETVALRDRVDEATDDRIDEVRAAALLGLDAGPAESGAPDAPPEDRRPEPPFSRPLPTGRRGGEDALLVVIGASTGLGLGRLIVAPMASVQTLQWISMPLTLLLGVAAAALVIRVRRAAALRAEIRGWSNDALGETRGRLDHRVGARVAAAEPYLTSQITRYYDRRARHVAGRVAEIDERLRALRSGTADQARREQLGRMRSTRRELAALADALVGEDDRPQH
ncbi:hypothetical protein [Gordonia sp. OPL2]|uniref:hypothetical protein n=1 Tax=Gordonia sp. OPL2 TaxID=2486274 RepID=UPI001655E4B1|nr:hypothetical protein [Gordonia sp. OPL2]ROZ99109.1 hypothetical protein EEB19_13260 [Gordonia sp. OPL2]